jgi:hypothetical protein
MAVTAVGSSVSDCAETTPTPGYPAAVRRKTQAITRFVITVRFFISSILHLSNFGTDYTGIIETSVLSSFQVGQPENRPWKRVASLRFKLS